MGLFSTFSLYQTPSLAVLSSLVTCKGFPFRSKQIIETSKHAATFNFAEPMHNNTEPSVNSNCHPTPKPTQPLLNHLFSVEA